MSTMTNDQLVEIKQKLEETRRLAVAANFHTLSCVLTGVLAAIASPGDAVIMKYVEFTTEMANTYIRECYETAGTQAMRRNHGRTVFGYRG